MHEDTEHTQSIQYTLVQTRNIHLKTQSIHMDICKDKAYTQILILIDSFSQSEMNYSFIFTLQDGRIIALIPFVMSPFGIYYISVLTQQF